MIDGLKDAIRHQRKKLTDMLAEQMHQLAGKCEPQLANKQQLHHLMSEALPGLSHCKHLYVLNAEGVQITNNIIPTGADESYYGRYRMDRPYMKGLNDGADFKLSDAYISKNKKRPSLTAVQVIRNVEGEQVGFLGADFDLRELPGIKESYPEPDSWRQVKGDPAIRSVVFSQQRTESQMDMHLDQVIPIMSELMTEHGVFHGKIHFSSSRATIWLADDPFSYRILSFDEIIDPEICLAYPHREYHERAIVPVEQIMEIFEVFRELRFVDDNIYLRAGSLNVINGMVGLNFSCDGSHYMRFDEFLNKRIDFWFGKTGT